MDQNEKLQPLGEFFAENLDHLEIIEVKDLEKALYEIYAHYITYDTKSVCRESVKELLYKVSKILGENSEVILERIGFVMWGKYLTIQYSDLYPIQKSLLDLSMYVTARIKKKSPKKSFAEKEKLNPPSNYLQEVLDNLQLNDYELIIESLLNLMGEIRGSINGEISSDTGDVRENLLDIRDHFGAEFDSFIRELGLYYHKETLYCLDSDYQRTAIAILEITNFMTSKLEKHSEKSVQTIQESTSVNKGRAMKPAVKDEPDTKKGPNKYRAELKGLIVLDEEILETLDGLSIEELYELEETFLTLDYRMSRVFDWKPAKISDFSFEIRELENVLEENFEYVLKRIGIEIDGDEIRYIDKERYVSFNNIYLISEYIDERKYGEISISEPNEAAKEILDRLHPAVYKDFVQGMHGLIEAFRTNGGAEAGSSEVMLKDVSEYVTFLMTILNDDINPLLKEAGIEIKGDKVILLNGDYVGTYKLVMQLTSYLGNINIFLNMNDERKKSMESNAKKTPKKPIFGTGIGYSHNAIKSKNSKKKNSFLTEEVSQNTGTATQVVKPIRVPREKSPQDLQIQIINNVDRLTNNAETIKTLAGYLYDFYMPLDSNYDSVEEGGVIDEGIITVTEAIDDHYTIYFRSASGASYGTWNFFHKGHNDEVVEAVFSVLRNRKVLLIKKGNQGYLRLPSVH